MTIQQFPVRAAHGRSAHANGTTGHSASHPAVQHKTAAVSCGETVVPVASTICSAMTLSAALWKVQHMLWKYVHLNQCISGLQKTAPGKGAMCVYYRRTWHILSSVWTWMLFELCVINICALMKYIMYTYQQIYTDFIAVLFMNTYNILHVLVT